MGSFISCFTLYLFAQVSVGVAVAVSSVVPCLPLGMACILGLRLADAGSYLCGIFNSGLCLANRFRLLLATVLVVGVLQGT